MTESTVTQRVLCEKLAFSIREFCELHGISRAHYYQLRNLGLGPREMDVRGRRTISFEAAADWRREREDAARKQQTKWSTRMNCEADNERP